MLPDPDALADVVIQTIETAQVPLVGRLAATEARLAAAEARLERLVLAEAVLVELGKETVTLRERAAVLETRPQLQGPPGDPGPAGKDGADGKPGLSYLGVYQDGKTYDVGELVTWAGSAWHCNEATTTKPGDGSKAWTLMVKRGRDGKDGQL